MKRYRKVEGIGPYMNHRWEVQVFHHLGGWNMVFHSINESRCAEVLTRYNEDAKAKRNTPLIDLAELPCVFLNDNDELPF